MRLLAGAPADLKGDTLEESQEWSFVQPGKWLASELAALRFPDQQKKYQLRPIPQSNPSPPYQQAGVNWLWLLSQLGLGACLADDMGLGKTTQVISLLLVLNWIYRQLLKEKARGGGWQWQISLICSVWIWKRQ